MTFAGFGKTVIAAFDYKRFKKANPRARLLFVAHRKEILEQSIQTFQEILNDFNFGELYVDSRKPTDIEHLFISIQSFNSAKLAQWTTPDYYDYICVDEFHHAAANSYQELLSYYHPKILLGLTATPDRMDEKDILKYFDGTLIDDMAYHYYKNYYYYEMDNEFALRAAVSVVLAENNITVDGFEMWIP